MTNIKTFREFLAENSNSINEVKISNTHALKYFKLIQQSLNSKTFDTNLKDNVLEVKYDDVSLFFKDSYLVGFEYEGEYYEVSKDLRSVKELRSIRDISKFLGKTVSSPKQMRIPNEPVYMFQPKDGNELSALVKELIKERGNNADLNDIDVSKVTEMRSMFKSTKFNGDISKWDVSNVNDMTAMFYASKFNGDISKWDVSNVTEMRSMFHSSQFNQDISNWDVSKVTVMSTMFYASKFNGDISKWDVSKVIDMDFMFEYSKFDQDINNWNPRSLISASDVFKDSPLEGNEPDWYLF